MKSGDIIKKQAGKIVKRNTRISIAFWCIVGTFLLVGLVVFIFSWLIGDKQISNDMIKWVDDNSKAIAITSWISSALFFVIKIIFKLTNAFPTDEQHIIKTLKEEYIQK